ncbi:DUF1415 domain-containing protein [Pseudoflavitalea sp. G-6-1-2]|nr:DUF1415 domain-containing protein [Pseudoflavitalea sp. G-6-1-2]
MQPDKQKVIEQTLNWIREVVIKCNFCPFAAKEVKRNSIHYEVIMQADRNAAVEAFLRECKRLDADAAIETTLLIFPQSFGGFKEYLELVKFVERAVRKNGYEGVYQVATFHPDYFFAGAPMDDAANFTNRSIYPMLHILRESSIEAVLEKYAEPERIPEANMRFAREHGAAYMKMLRDSCL